MSAPRNQSDIPLSERSAARLGHTAADRFVRALESSPHVGTFSPPDALRSAINDFVDELKTQGSPPERVLINVKRVVFEAHPVSSHDEDYLRFLQHVITWCIEAYYRDR
jgi:hypothetical protein